MIIGNGILANAVRSYDREDVIYFASGVSILWKKILQNLKGNQSFTIHNRKIP
jgi:hypothetical protein